jgi:hypothetical protein
MNAESSEIRGTAGSSLEILRWFSGQVAIPLKGLFGAVGVLLVLILLTVNLEMRLPVVHVPSEGVGFGRPGHTLLGPGRHGIHEPALQTTHDWFLQPLADGVALATGRPGGKLEVPFYGTTISLIARVGPETGRVYVQIDGASVETLSQDERGSYVNLRDERAIDETIKIADGLPHGEHVLTVTNGRSGQLAISGLIVDAETPFSWAFAVTYLVLSAALFATIREIAVTIGKQLDWLPITSTFSIRRPDTPE